MTKKDYVHVIAEIADSIAYVMERDNPRFNRERFLAACGVQS